MCCVGGQSQPQEEPGSPEAGEPPPAEAARRKSTSWKTFNLKRQLSKVDLKFKAAFAPPAELGLDEERSPSSPEEPSDSDSSRLASPVAAPDKRASDAYERMHRELQERWREREADEADGDAAERPERPERRRARASDGRLLSVPNIKYREGVRDLRRRGAPPPPPPPPRSLMRRFSK